jgi:hypothetical protein
MTFDYMAEDDEPPVEHFRRLVAAVDRRLAAYGSTAADLDDAALAERATLREQRAGWVREIDRLTVDDHWTSGDGDRTLF